jgi:hypothetical protein
MAAKFDISVEKAVGQKLDEDRTQFDDEAAATIQAELSNWHRNE